MAGPSIPWVECQASRRESNNRIGASMPARRRNRFNLPALGSRHLARSKANTAYKRHLKSQNQLKCEICGYFDPSIQPYHGIESHHIQQVASGGSDRFSNLLACCPTHHALADRLSRADPTLSRMQLIKLLRSHDESMRVARMAHDMR